MRKLTWVICIAVILLGVGVYANTPFYPNLNMDLDLQYPGARALGMGGAFIALADDASAVEINPAGLCYLRGWEFSTEYRYDARDYQIWDAYNKSDSNSGPKYLSIAWGGSRGAIGFSINNTYRDQLAFNVPGIPVPGYHFYPYSADINRTVTNYNISGALRANDHLWFGATVGYAVFDPHDMTTTFEDTINDSWAYRNFNKSRDFTYTLGALVRFNDKFSMGLMYNHAPSFDLDETTFAHGMRWDYHTKMHFPDRYGVGFAIHPNDQWAIAADYLHVKWSNLADNYVDPYPPYNTDQVESKDGWEGHLGVEYTTPTKLPVNIRFGYARIAEHGLSYGSGWTDPTIRYGLAYTPSADHYSAGFGISVAKYVKLDAAYDYSKDKQVASVAIKVDW